MLQPARNHIQQAAQEGSRQHPASRRDGNKVSFGRARYESERPPRAGSLTARQLEAARRASAPHQGGGRIWIRVFRTSRSRPSPRKSMGQTQGPETSSRNPSGQSCCLKWTAVTEGAAKEAFALAAAKLPSATVVVRDSGMMGGLGKENEHGI